MFSPDSGVCVKGEVYADTLDASLQLENLSKKTAPLLSLIFMELPLLTPETSSPRPAAYHSKTLQRLMILLVPCLLLYGERVLRWRQQTAPQRDQSVDHGVVILSADGVGRQDDKDPANPADPANGLNRIGQAARMTEKGLRPGSGGDIFAPEDTTEILGVFAIDIDANKQSWEQNASSQQPAVLRGAKRVHHAGISQALIELTGQLDDSVAGTLLSWPRAAFSEVLAAADRFHGHVPQGLWRRARVVVQRPATGTALPAFVFHRLPPPVAVVRIVKEKLTGRQQLFDFELWWQGRRQDMTLPPALHRRGAADGQANVVVGRWMATEKYGFPPGTYSWGVWWSDRPYCAIRLHLATDDLMAYRLDCLSETNITLQRSPPTIHFLDVFLDAWLYPSAHPQFRPRSARDVGVAGNMSIALEDEDEVAQHQASGLLTPSVVQLLARCEDSFVHEASLLKAEVDAAIEHAVAAYENRINKKITTS
eukprot:g30258.t1